MNMMSEQSKIKSKYDPPFSKRDFLKSALLNYSLILSILTFVMLGYSFGREGEALTSPSFTIIIIGVVVWSLALSYSICIVSLIIVETSDILLTEDSTLNTSIHITPSYLLPKYSLRLEYSINHKEYSMVKRVEYYTGILTGEDRQSGFYAVKIEKRLSVFHHFASLAVGWGLQNSVIIITPHHVNHQELLTRMKSNEKVT